MLQGELPENKNWVYVYHHPPNAYSARVGLEAPINPATNLINQ